MLSKKSLEENPELCAMPSSDQVSKDSLKKNSIEQPANSKSQIPKLSSCFRSSNSSLESLEPQSKPSKTSLGENSSTSRTSLLPSCLKSSDSTYILALEQEYESLQVAFFALTSQFAKVQFRLRQIIQAKPDERDHLLAELTHVAFCGIDDEMEVTNMPRMKKDLETMGNIRRRQGYLIDRLRSQLEYLTGSDCSHEENKAGTHRKSVRIDTRAKK